MINRIEGQNPVSYAPELEERRKKDLQDKDLSQGVKVELSRGLVSQGRTDYEDLSKKVEFIRQSLQSGTYEVSPEKLLMGLEKYFSSK